MRPMFIRINERGFIFAELAIGLPLIILMLWSMGHLFVGTWTTCRNLIADLTLQMEVRDAMSRIVDDMRSARKLSWDGTLTINSYFDGNDEILEDDTKVVARRPIFYTRDWETDDDGKNRIHLYRKRQKFAANDQPLTGQDMLSKTHVMQFSCVEEKPRLWRITLKARSDVSGHEFMIKTAVYAEGADR